MYINLKRRKNKKGITVFYVYIAKSFRVEGVVKNEQRYVGSICEERIKKRDYSFMDTRKENFTIDELIMVVERIDKLRLEGT